MTISDDHPPEVTKAAPDAAPTAPAPPPSPTPAAPPEPRGVPRWTWAALATAVGVGLVVSNVFLILTVLDTSDTVDAIQERVGNLGGDLAVLGVQVEGASAGIDDVESAVGAVSDRVAALEAGPAPATTAVAAPEDGEQPDDQLSPAPAIAVEAGLPRFEDNSAQDPAIGLQIAEITGVEYYEGQEVTFALDDGKARAVMVWAHWCPFCQDELPLLADWHSQEQDTLANFELVSITTAMDDAAANPLFPYLDDNQFTFPVIVDSSGELSAQLGVNAFPFWVFVGPDGTVLGRLAGLLGAEQFVDIFAQLDGIAASAADGG